MSKKVVILGASSDIGVETVKIFLNKEWEVVAHYNNNPKILKEFKKNSKNKITLIKIDFKKTETAKKIVNKNKKLFSKVNSFISLIGYMKSEKGNKFNFNSIVEHIKVNFFSNLIIIDAIKNQMLKMNFGRILLSSSIGTKFGGSKNTFAYSISKFLNEFIPNEFKKKNAKKIIYNIIQIGVTDTKLHKKIKNKNMKKRRMLIPIKRIANSSEVAKKIFFLSSEKNTLIQGQMINISGGE